MGPLFSEVIGPSTYNWIRGTTSSPAHLRDPWWSVVQFNGHPLHCLTKWVKKTIHVRFKMEATYNNPPPFFSTCGFLERQKIGWSRRCEPDSPPVQTLVGKVHLSEMTAASLKQPSVGGRQEVTRWYCWWFRNPAITSWYGKYPFIYRVLYIPGGCLGCLPSTVCTGVWTLFWFLEIGDGHQPNTMGGYIYTPIII